MIKEIMLKLLLLILFMTGISQARNYRVNQIPNGTVFSCNNCHVTPGGPRNLFGQTVEAGFLDGSGNVLWGSDLAGLDSDGDGIANGVELQDPDGTWAIGEPDPGDANLVTNPGDPSSLSVIRVVHNVPVIFQLFQNYPNPFNAETVIDFSAPEKSCVTIEVLNLKGEVVNSWSFRISESGKHSVVWDGTNRNGQLLSSGVYFYKMKTGKFHEMKRMIFLK